MAHLGYWGLAAIVIATGAGAGLLAWLTRRFVRIDVLRRHHEVGSAIFLQLGVVFAVLLAFVFSEVWSEYNSAASAMDQECGALNGVIMLSAALPPAPRQEMKTLIGAYAKDVVTVEFPAMRGRRASEITDIAFQALWTGVVGLPTERSQDLAIRDSMLSQLAIAHQNRDIRLTQMNQGVPALIWLLLLFYVFILVAFLLFFAVEYIVSQVIFTATFAACLAFILLVVQALDFPFEGVLRLPPTAFQGAVNRVATLPGG